MDEPTDNRDDLLTIVNRSKTYRVSKQLLCFKVPYFEKMFSSGLKESQENKVELDFDERCFQLIINAVNNSLLIQFKDVILLYDVADYLMMEEFKSIVHNFFFDKFNIDCVDFLLTEVTETSKLINTKMMNLFVERHFLKLMNAASFLNLDLETLDTILKLDLWIDSEYQVFEAIIKWINKDRTLRAQYCSSLLKNIRWSYVDANDMKKMKDEHMIKSSDFPVDFLFNDQDTYRVTPNVLLALFSPYCNSQVIDIFYRDSEAWSKFGSFTLNDELPDHILCDDTFIDIIYDSGSKRIRVDLIHMSFRPLDPINYFRKLVTRDPSRSFSKYDCDQQFLIFQENLAFTLRAIVESNGRLYFPSYHLTNNHESGEQTIQRNICFYPYEYCEDFVKFEDDIIPATCFKGQVCVLFNSNDFSLACLDLKSRVTLPIPTLRYNADESITLAGNDSTLLLATKASKSFHFYDSKTRRWTQDDVYYTGELVGIASLKIPMFYIDRLNDGW